MDQQPMQTEKTTFDMAVMAKLKNAADSVLTEHPEVDCVCAVVSWKGNLNDAGIKHGIWVGDQGPVGTAEGIFGSMYQLIKMFDEQATRAVKYVEHVREKVEVLGTELRNRHEELEAVKAEIAKCKAQVQSDAGGTKTT